MGTLESAKYWITETVLPKFLTQLTSCQSVSDLSLLAEQIFDQIQLKLLTESTHKKRNKATETQIIDAILIQCVTYEDAVQASLTHI